MSDEIALLKETLAKIKKVNAGRDDELETGPGQPLDRSRYIGFRLGPGPGH